MRRYGRPEVLVTDRLPSYKAALRDLGCKDLQACGRWLNNRVENSHPLPSSGLFKNQKKKKIKTDFNFNRFL